MMIPASRMPRKNILQLLAGGDRRTIGCVDEVVARVSNDREFFAKLIAELWSDNPLIRMRAADAIEKITRRYPELLQRYKNELLGLMAETQQQGLRWHLAVMIPRIALNESEQLTAVSSLIGYLEDSSSIVKTFTLQGLADFAQREAAIRPRVIEILREATRKGTPAMKARGGKLLVRLGKMSD